MTSEIRNRAPAAWMLLPVLLATGTSAVTAWATESLPLAAAAALGAGWTAAWWSERRLRSVIEPIAQIAAGDRYAALPDRIGRGPMAEMAAAALADVPFCSACTAVFCAHCTKGLTADAKAVEDSPCHSSLDSSVTTLLMPKAYDCSSAATAFHPEAAVVYDVEPGPE